VQDWMLLRLPRRAAIMREAAALLDRVAWESGRLITRATAADCLAPLLADTGDELSESALADAADTARLL
jgi:hypothetical protein